MHVKPLGHTTGVYFPRFEDEVLDRTSYLVARDQVVGTRRTGGAFGTS